MPQWARECEIEGCDHRHLCRGWCRKHYERWRRHGDPEHPASHEPKRDWIERVANTTTDDCIEWPWGKRSEDGYGILRIGENKIRVSHLILEASGRSRPDPPGNLALHSCDNPPCSNPRHLRWGTQYENVQDRELRRA